MFSSFQTLKLITSQNVWAPNTNAHGKPFSYNHGQLTFELHSSFIVQINLLKSIITNYQQDLEFDILI